MFHKPDLVDGQAHVSRYPGFTKIDFNSRDSVLTTARTSEDLGVAAYNGAGQLLEKGEYLLLAGKIVSVEARHATAIRYLIGRKGNASASNGSGTTVGSSTGGGNSPSNSAGRPAKRSAPGVADGRRICRHWSTIFAARMLNGWSRRNWIRRCPCSGGRRSLRCAPGDRWRAGMVVRSMVLPPQYANLSEALYTSCLTKVIGSVPLLYDRATEVLPFPIEGFGQLAVEAVLPPSL